MKLTFLIYIKAVLIFAIVKQTGLCYNDDILCPVKQLKFILKNTFYRLFSDVSGKLYLKGEAEVLPNAEISVPEEQFGDYSTNLAMRLAKIMKLNPKDLAENLAENG